MKFLLLMNVARRALVRAGQGSNLQCVTWPVVSVARYLDAPVAIYSRKISSPLLRYVTVTVTVH
jgi:hypothetical protein